MGEGSVHGYTSITLIMHSYLVDYYDWALLGYHALVVVLGVIAVNLYLRTLQCLPSRYYRKRLADEQYGSSSDAFHLLLEMSFSNQDAPERLSVTKDSRDRARQAEDRLRMFLGRSIRIAGWLQTTRSSVSVLICAAISCAAVQGLVRLSTEKQPAAWAYHESLMSMFRQLLWGLPLAATVYLLDARSTVVLKSYRYQLDRLSRWIVNLGPNDG